MSHRITFSNSMFDTNQKGSILPIRMLKTRTSEESIYNKHGLYTSSVFFPTVAKSAPCIRIAITAPHTEEELKLLNESFMSLKLSTLEAICG